MQIETITSSANPRIKEIIQLRDKSKARKEKSLFPVEGEREINAALTSGYQAKALFFNSGITDIDDILSRYPAIPQTGECPFYSLSREAYSRIAMRDSTEGEVVLFKYSLRTLEQLILSSNPLIIVAEGVEKPGNIGALLRTADAVNADAVIICDSPTDLFNPNIIRASLGGIFTNNVVSCSSRDAYAWLTENKIQIFSAQLQDSVSYFKSDMTGPMAVIMGSEAKGVTSYWRERADHRIFIPMMGSTDSLNVSVSTAILCYEAIRQRAIK
jgi:TrmH family RNA methyltransferase